MLRWRSKRNSAGTKGFDRVSAIQIASPELFAETRSTPEREIEFIEESIFWIFVAGIASVPFWYGSADQVSWGINALLFCGLAALYEISLLARRKSHPVAARYIALPATFFAVAALWIEFQTVTFSYSFLENPIWSLAAAALGKSIEGSISVDRDLTNLALLRLITAASVFWIALQLCRDGVRAKRFVIAIAVIGFCYAAYGLVATRTGPLPWLDIPKSTLVSSTFLNRNSYVAYAGLGLIATAGLMIEVYLIEIAGAAENWRLEVASLIETTGQKGAALLACAFVIAVALLFTGSRGGIVATGFGLLVLAVLSRQGGSKGQRGSLTLIIFAFFLVAATMLAFGNVLVDSLEERGVTDASRMSVYLLTLRSIFDKPLLGFGYGTFVDVFQMYRDRSLSVGGIWGEAHNTYLEIFQGLGLVFGSLLIASVVLLIFRCIKGSIERQMNAVVPRIAAAGACLLGVHALVDFSLQIQGVALTFMAVLGAGVAQSETSRLSLAD